MAWQTIHLRHGIRAITSTSIAPTTTSKSSLPVVLLAGWPETAEAFNSVLEPLSRKHRFLALDPPGLGYSAAPPTGKYDTKSLSQLIADAVHNDSSLFPENTSNQQQKYHLVGHDIGAWIAYPWAAQYGSRVASLTILDAGVPGLLPAPPSYPLPDEMNMKLWQFSFNALPELPEMLVCGREGELIAWMFKHKISAQQQGIPLDSEDRAEAINRYVECYARPGAMSRAFEFYRAFGESAAQNRRLAAVVETQLAMPVLALGGADGGVGERIVGMVSGIAPHVQGGAIEQCGHFVMEEQPAVVARRLLEFFDAVETGVTNYSN